MAKEWKAGGGRETEGAAVLRLARLCRLPPAVPNASSCTELARPTPTDRSSMSFSLNTTGGVASRFVSQKDLDEAKANKDKEWAEAYARCVAASSELQA